MNVVEIIEILEQQYPDAKCELNYRNAFELTVAVVLSAQTTDIAVNKVTKELFKKYDTPSKLANASLEDVESTIKQIGLYHNKTLNIIELSKQLIDDFNGEVPNTMNELISLKGVGKKTANVILAECFNIPALAVDTHVERVSKRLGLVNKKATVEEVERALKKKIPIDLWIKSHLLLLFFGRYQCQARKPLCENCKFISICKQNKKSTG